MVPDADNLISATRTRSEPSSSEPAAQRKATPSPTSAHTQAQGPKPAMQSMPLLLRQSLRSSIHITRTTSRPVHPQFRPSTFPVSPRPTARPFSVCLRCQFRRQPGFFSPQDEKEKDKASNDAERLAQAVREAPDVVIGSEGDAGASRAVNSSAEGGEHPQGQSSERRAVGQQEQTEGNEHSAGSASAQSGGLPSYLESRRSKLSKQFTTMMDNIQSNVFVAGQRLNDLTGYSGIEALKNEIHSQGTEISLPPSTLNTKPETNTYSSIESRLRDARAQVRKAKDDYTAAINRRSTSQREVNELLQRKHAWSPTDLERFTLLYRNDHANEVAETETQEALSLAEREAEEAAASLSKSILSRYHEEQVWSDKIRRMSTWGTWGLMGVNVLLFLIFQIAVEPWRRKRLVKGFEDKVVEALEKEKALNRVAGEGAGVSASMIPEVIDSTLETEELSTPALVSASSGADVPAAAEGGPLPSPDTTVPPTEILSSRLSSIPSSPLSLAYWEEISRELFSERSIAISQRDLTMAAMQSAAAGAAVMGLVIAVVRPW